MATAIFVNLPVSDLARSKAFFTALGYTINPQFSDDTILCLGAPSRDEVDRIADAALAGGGSPVSDPQDHGFMYGRSFADPDGHIWEVMWMDPAVASGAKPGDM